MIYFSGQIKGKIMSTEDHTQVKNVSQRNKDSDEEIKQLIQKLVDSGEVSLDQIQENLDDKMNRIVALQEMYRLVEDLSPDQREILEDAIKRRE